MCLYMSDGLKFSVNYVKHLHTSSKVKEVSSAFSLAAYISLNTYFC